MKNVTLWLLIPLSLVLIASSSSFPALATPLGEEGFKTLIDQNPDLLIFDIRLRELYEVGHLRGAINVDPDLETEDQVAAVLVELVGRNISKSHPLALLCNCPNGGFAKVVEDHLNTQGYHNTAHLDKSFSYWTDPAYLVAGPTPAGTTTLSVIPENFGQGSGSAEMVLISVIALAILSLVAGLVIYMKTGPVNKSKKNSSGPRNQRQSSNRSNPKRKRRRNTR